MSENALKIFENYKSYSYPRGFCIIINIVNYDTDNDNLRRDGSEESVNLISGIFKYYEFDVRIFTDLNDNKVINTIEKFIGDDECKDHNAFILYIFSHGIKDSILCSNNELIHFYQIYELFKDENCGNLKDKLKFIFFDCCRVDDFELENPHYDFNRADHFNRVNDLFYSDLIICYSTLKGLRSARNWLAKCLHESILKFAQNQTFNDILFEANKLLDSKYDPTKPHKQGLQITYINQKSQLYLKSYSQFTLERKIINELFQKQFDVDVNEQKGIIELKGNKSIKLKTIFKLIEIISTQQFNDLIIMNKSIETIPQDLICNLNFNHVEFANIDNLKSIHKNAFGINAMQIKSFHAWKNLPNLKSHVSNNDYDLNELINSLRNCEIIWIKPFDFKRFRLRKLKKLNISGFYQDGINEVEIESINDFAFYECDQIELICLKGNNIMSINEHSFHFENSSANLLQIDLRGNKLTEESFAINSLIYFKRPVILNLESNEIKYLKEEIFKPFFMQIDKNKVYATKNFFTSNSLMNKWINLQDFKPRILEHDLKELLKKKFNINYDDEQKIICFKPIRKTDDIKKFFSFINCYLDTFKENQNFEESHQRHFSELIVEDQFIEILQENVLGEFSFDKIRIENCPNLRYIHKNAFGPKIHKIIRFEARYNLPNLTSEQNYYDLNNLIKSLVNCEFLIVKPFEMEINSINLKHLKVLWFESHNSLPKSLTLNNNPIIKITAINEYAFYECDQIEKIDLSWNQIKLINENSFHFKNKSAKELTIILKHNNLSEESFSINSLIQFKRPVKLDLRFNKISYLSETIFKPFLDANEINSIFVNQLEINHKNNKWFLNYKNYSLRVNHL